MAFLELATLLVVGIGVLGLFIARSRASLRSRKRFDASERSGASQQA